MDKRLLRYQELISYMTDLLWMTDMELFFTNVSPSIEHLLGYNFISLFRNSSNNIDVKYYS